MNVFGLDPSITRTGLAWDGGQRSFSSKAIEGGTVVDSAGRIVRMVTEVVARLKHAELVVLEDAARRSKQAFYVANYWWVLLCAIVDEEIPVAIVSPSTLKAWIADKGNADKDEVMAALRVAMPDRKPANDDEADALVLYAIGRELIGQPVANVPESRRKKLKSVLWPKGLQKFVDPTPKNQRRTQV